MLLSIIIVSYNTEKLLEECISSIVKSVNKIDCEIIIVDNDSKDSSVNMLKTQFPYVKVIENNFNAGFAKANNQGYEVSSGKYVLLLNSDTIVLNDALNRLVSFIEENENCGIAGPKLLNDDLSLQLPCRREFPGFMNSFAHFSGLSKIFPRNKTFGSYNMTYVDSKQSHEVDAVSGACLIIRKEIIEELGLLDEGYFMHFEDIDLCYKVKRAGWKIFYVHDADIIHLKGQSSKLRSKGVIMNFYDSALRYFKKNYRERNFLAYFFIVLVVMAMKNFTFLLYNLKRFTKGKKIVNQ